MIAKLFERDVHGRFYGHAREHVLRLIWTSRRLLEENEELRRRLGADAATRIRPPGDQHH